MKSGHNGPVCFSFKGIIRGRKVCQRDAVFPVQSSLQKKVTDVRILGQKRPMKISAYNTAVEDAFTGVLFVVAVTI